MMTALLANLLLGVSPAHAADRAIDARVTAVRARSERVEAGVTAKVWTSARFVPDGVTTQGAEATAWCNGKQLQKANVTWMGEGGRSDQIFLYEDGVPVFIFEDEVLYTPDSSGDGMHQKTRYYFEGATLVRMVTPDGATVDRPAGPTAERGRYLRAEALKYGKACPTP